MQAKFYVRTTLKIAKDQGQNYLRHLPVPDMNSLIPFRYISFPVPCQCRNHMTVSIKRVSTLQGARGVGY